MYRTAKSLEITEVEVQSCFILCPYVFLHKTLIMATKNCTYISLLLDISYTFEL